MIKKIRAGYDPALPTENVYEISCPILHALEVIGGKWKLPILRHLADRQGVGYNALHRGVKGISNMMLSKCLKELLSRQATIVASPKGDARRRGRREQSKNRAFCFAIFTPNR